jgi:DNA repair photolyase
MTTIEVVNTRTLLVWQKPTSFLADFDVSINPYCGCAFQCGAGRDEDHPGYCYVPDLMPAHVAKHGGWGNFVQVREPAVDVLRRALPRLAGKRAFMSPTTDVYQPVERQHRLTSRLLELLLDSGLEWLLINTRSPLILEDLELLRAFGPRVEVGISIPTDREDLRRALDPKCPSAERRLRTARELRAAGVPVRIQVAPMQPHTDAFPGRCAAAADWVWIDYPLHFRLGFPVTYRQLGIEAWLQRETIAEAVDRWRAELGTERVGFGRADFARRANRPGESTKGHEEARKGGSRQ